MAWRSMYQESRNSLGEYISDDDQCAGLGAIAPKSETATATRPPPVTPHATERRACWRVASKNKQPVANFSAQAATRQQGTRPPSRKRKPGATVNCLTFNLSGARPLEEIVRAHCHRAPYLLGTTPRIRSGALSCVRRLRHGRSLPRSRWSPPATPTVRSPSLTLLALS